MRHFHLRHTLLAQITTVLVILMLPMSSISLFSNAQEQAVVREGIFAQQESSVSFYLTMLENELGRLQTLAYAYSDDIDLIKVSQAAHWASPYERVQTILNIRKKLSQTKVLSNYINNIFIEFPISDYSINAITSDDEYNADTVCALLEPENIGNTIVQDHGKYYVKAYFPASSLTSSLPRFLVYMELNSSLIASNIQGTSAQGNALLFSDQWCLSTQASIPDDVFERAQRLTQDKEHGVAVASWMGESCLLAWSRSSFLGATLLTYLPQSAVLKRLWGIEKFLYLLIFMQIITLAGSVFLLYVRVHVPINCMADAFRGIEAGDESIRLDIGGKKDEFEYLYASFNHLMDTIQTMQRQVYEQRILSQQSELKQLQMQINPHFFYNSFFAVRGMLEMGDSATASKMLESLGRYFQFITRSGKDSVPLQAEVEHAQAYCDIQRIRFENTAVSFEPLPEALKDLIVPRLILQPLIENAYVHGLESRQEGGYLRVLYHTGWDGLRITVLNNGLDNPCRRVPELQQLLASNTREKTALLNIHRRLQLFYGETYGLEILLAGDDGLSVSIHIPFKGEENATNSICGQ